MRHRGLLIDQSPEADAGQTAGGLRAVDLAYSNYIRINFGFVALVKAEPVTQSGHDPSLLMLQVANSSQDSISGFSVYHWQSVVLPQMLRQS